MCLIESLSRKEKAIRKTNSEDQAISLFTKARWPKKVKCPYCNQHYTYNIDNYSKFHCLVCQATFNLRTRTVFHDTKFSYLRILKLIEYCYFDDYSFSKVAKLLGTKSVTVHQYHKKLGSFFGIKKSLRKRIPPKEIVALDKTYQLIDMFENISKAAKTTGIIYAHIKEVLNKKRVYAGGYIWMYLDDYELNYG